MTGEGWQPAYIRVYICSVSTVDHSDVQVHVSIVLKLLLLLRSAAHA